MRRLVVVALSGMAVFYAFATLATKAAPPAADIQPHLDRAAPSVDALLDDLLRAVAARDEAALHRLRVTEAEYGSIIVPGTVEEGAPLRTTPEYTTKFFWRMLDAKSRDLGRALLGELGGEKLERQSVNCTKGVKKYRGYTAIGEVRLTAMGAQGNIRLVRAGTIAEVNGRYKFIGFNYNN